MFLVGSTFFRELRRKKSIILSVGFVKILLVIKHNNIQNKNSIFNFVYLVPT